MSYYGVPLETGEDSLVTRGRKAAGLKDKAIDPKTGKLIRFHGAFTGGFSSGYYNTVSTKEGWTPSQYFSTREQRSDNVRQQPEDYMDDEDFSDQGIAPKNFTPTESYSLNNNKRTSAVRDDLTTSLLEKTSLLSFSNTSSIGFDLMRTMGWSEGQGVGPVIRKSLPEVTIDDTTGIDKDKQIIVANSGSESEGEIIEEEIVKDPITTPREYFATPQDFKGSAISIKEDKMGLGYTGMRAPSSTINKYQLNTPFPSNTENERITSLFGGTLNNPYDVDELDTSSNITEWYRQEATSDDEDNTFGWSGGGEGLRLASFEQIGNLYCIIPPCKVKIPPNYTPTASLSNTAKNTKIQPYTEQSAAARGKLLSGQSTQPKLQYDSSKLKFNPLIQSLSSRFVPAQIPDSVTEVQTTTVPGLNTLKQEVKTPQKNKEKLEWHPHRILCKRFDIPDPYPSSGLVGVPFRPEKLTFSSLMLSMGGASESAETKESLADTEEAVPWCPTSSDHLPSSDQRPPIDLFTSVFGGESSCESEGEETEDLETKPVEEGTPKIAVEDRSHNHNESLNSLQALAQMASKEIERKRNIEEKKRKRKSKFVEAEEIEGDKLPKFSLEKVFGTDLPEMFAPAVPQDESDEDKSNHKDQNRFKRKERDKDRNYSSRHSSSHHDKRYHHYSSSNSHRRK
ncbi:G patch domain-containing protein 1 [Oopsacas minuta]|uniref:G patch domain-containing protein 1 n=1 Tax=Oopsacas minuta TaxID=111878 RepID=A0AAV7K2E4_9METZ|nr:G patch domain-containing protein 1 [Oopsacas minuta]